MNLEEILKAIIERRDQIFENRMKVLKKGNDIDVSYIFEYYTLNYLMDSYFAAKKIFERTQKDVLEAFDPSKMIKLRPEIEKIAEEAFGKRTVIEVKSIIGNKYALSREDGKKIKKFIDIALKESEKIVVSLKGIEVMHHHFLYEIFEDLFEIYTREQIEDLIIFSDCSNPQKELIEQIKDFMGDCFKKRRNGVKNDYGYSTIE